MRKFYLKQPEAHYINPVEDNIQEEIESRLRDRTIASYRTKIVVAGKMVSISSYPVWKTQKNNERANKNKPSREAQIKLNDKNAVRKLIDIINENFVAGDVWLHLTYNAKHMPKTQEQAKADIRNFCRRLKYYCKKHKMPEPKFVYIFGHDEDRKMRYHFHVVTNFRDRDILESFWKLGRTQAERLQPDEYEFSGMATYMGRHLGLGKRYVASRNIVVPQPHIDSRGLSRRKVSGVVFNQEAAGELILQYLAKKGYDCTLLEMPKIKLSDYVSGAYMYARLRLKEPRKDGRRKNTNQTEDINNAKK